MSTIRQYIDKHMPHERRAVRERIGQEAGVTEPAVRHWANGTRSIPARRIQAVARAIGVDAAVLLDELNERARA